MNKCSEAESSQTDERSYLILGQEDETMGLAIWSDHVGLAKFAKNYFEYLWADTNLAKEDKTSKLQR